MLSIKSSSQGKKVISDFIDFPYSLYREDKNWVPPLRSMMKEKFDKKRGAFLKSCEAEFFVAYSGNKPVGRVTAQIDTVFNSYNNENKGFFGFYESINDIKVTKLLMENVEKWLKERGMKSCIGPFHFNINDECGFQVEGFDRPPVVMMPYSKPYYPDLFKASGYQTVQTLLSFVMENVTATPQIVSRMSEKIRKKVKDVTIRKIDMKNLDKEAEIILDIYNEAWSDNWGFTPMTRHEIDELIRSLKTFADPRVIYLLYKGNDPAGCLVAIPDLNRILIKNRKGRLTPMFLWDFIKNRKALPSFRILIMGVKSKYRKLGLDFLMYNETFSDGLKTENYRNVEMGWILEQNALMISVFNRIGAHPLNKYIIIEKKI
jgi:hypothetical protein